MSRRWFVVLPLAALVVIGLLIAGGSAIRRAGWSQGYATGRLEATAQDGAVPQVPYGLGHYRGRHLGPVPSLHGVGLLFGVGFLVLALVAIGRFFHFWAWRKADSPWATAEGPTGGRWARHWHRHHGPMPFWCWGWGKPSEEKAEPEPDAEAGDTEA